jgi:hypothetical protein
MPEPETPETEIKVFAESGHHYSFLPFAPRSADGASDAAHNLRTGTSAVGQCLPYWLRGRFGMNEGQHGMWVALESNLGDIQRGSLYEPKRSYHAQEAGLHNIENPSPYAATDPTRLPDDLEAIPIEVELGKEKVTVAVLNVIWKKPAGEPREVDLIVDFGNTRTVVLALEHNFAQAGKLSTLCHSIRFIKRGADYVDFKGSKQDDSCSIVDSWFILHEPMFADFEPPRPGFSPTTEIHKEEKQVKEGLLSKTRLETSYSGIKRVPQMFVEMSPWSWGTAPAKSWRT